jgi:hypothetical protein
MGANFATASHVERLRRDAVVPGPAAGGSGEDRRVREADLNVPALRLAAASPGGFIATARLIDALDELFAPTGRDGEVRNVRAETYFAQKVRNLVSHRRYATSFIRQGFATYDPARRGIAITTKRRALLAALAQ